MNCCNDTVLIIQQGDDEVLPFTLTDKDAEGTVTPVDLTGATLYLAIRREGETSLAVDLSQNSHTDAEAGETSITIPRTTTKDLVADAPHTGTLQMKSSGGAVTTLAEFNVVVREALKIIV